MPPSRVSLWGTYSASHPSVSDRYTHLLAGEIAELVEGYVKLQYSPGPTILTAMGDHLVDMGGLWPEVAAQMVQSLLQLGFDEVRLN